MPADQTSTVLASFVAPSAAKAAMTSVEAAGVDVQDIVLLTR